jgi:Raf kinase inhibitor-like YbhB/YbcL family protein
VSTAASGRYNATIDKEAIMSPGLLVLALVVQSPSFADGQAIPKTNTCDGGDRSPALTVSELPAGAQTWAVIVDDPDAPGGTFTHWVIWNIPPRLRSILDEGQPRETLQLPDHARQGKNDFDRVGYNGPCPPPGKPHHYRFRVFALDGKLVLPARSSAGDLERAIRGHIIGQGTLTGVYGR